jgi:hypothetical protein
MQLLGVDAQSVLIAHVDGDGFVLFQVADVLVDKSQRSVGPPLGGYVLLNLPVFSGHIEIQRRRQNNRIAVDGEPISQP